MKYDIRPVTADMWDELATFFGHNGAYSNCWCAWWRVTANDFSAGCTSGGAGNREVLHKLTIEGRVPGLLAYALEPKPEPPAELHHPTKVHHPTEDDHPTTGVHHPTDAHYSTGVHHSTEAQHPAEPERPAAVADNRTYPLGWVSVGPRPDFGRIGRSRNLKPAANDDFDDASVWSIVCFWIPRADRGKGVGRALLAGAASYAFEHGASAVEGYPVDTRGERTQAASIFTGTVSMFEAAGFKEVLRRGDKRPVMRRDRVL